MPYVPLDGPQSRPPFPQQRPLGGFRPPLLPAALVVLYLAYIGAMVLAPYFIEPYGKVIDGILSPLIRLILAVVLMIVFGGLMLKELFQGKDQGPIAPDRSQVPRAAPLVAGPVIGSAQPRFTPISGTGPGPVAPPQTPTRVREIERGPSAPTIFTYPQDVEGGIYGDTYVQITPNKIIRIRSLVVDKRYMS